MIIDQNTIKKALISLLLCSLLSGSFFVHAEVLGKIAAVVEDEVILEQELDREVSAITQRIQASKTQMPPEYILRKQVLEKMIIDKLQRLMAEKAGITITEEMLNSSAADIAQRNNMTLQQFRTELQRQGISYKSFLDNMRNEIIINQLFSEETGSISIAHAGRMIRRLDPERLENILSAFYRPEQRRKGFFQRHFPYLFKLEE